MNTPQSTPGETPTGNLDARVAALEKYLAEHGSPSPLQDSVGGIVIHVSFGGIGFSLGTGPWIGGIMVCLAIVTVVLLLRRRVRMSGARQQPQ